MQSRIAKNTIYLTTGIILQKILAIVFFTAIVTKYFDVGLVGKYIFALSFTSMFGILIDWGLTNVLIRETARENKKASDYLGNIVLTKIFAALIIYLFVILVINIIKINDPVARNLVYISGIIMVLDVFTLSFYGVLRGLQNLKYEAWGCVLSQIIIIAAGFLVGFLQLPIYFLISCILAGSILNLLFSFGVLKLKYKLRLFYKFDKELIYRLIKIAIPFGIAGVFARVYGYIDTVLLSTLATDKDVAWYGAAYKITFALTFIPAAYSATLFPAFSQDFIKAKEKLAKNFERAVYSLMLISIPMCLASLVLAKKIIVFLYSPEYLSSIVVLQILMVSLVFVFLSYPVGALLSACNRQTTNTIMIGITLVVNVILNIILIPYYGYLAAAIASLAGNFILFTTTLYFVKQITDYNRWYLIKGFYKILFSGIIMAVVLLLTYKQINLLLLIPIGGVIYFMVLYSVRGFTKKEVVEVVKMFKK